MIGIVILNFNNIDDTIKCVDSVIKFSSFEDVKLFIVDNASTEIVYEKISVYLSNLPYKYTLFDCEAETNVFNFPEITYMRNRVNLGYANGNNSALSVIKHDDDIDYIMILNNDVLFTEPIIHPLIDYLKNNPDCGIVAPLLVGKDGKVDQECARMEKNHFHFLSRLPFFRDINYVKKKNKNNYIPIKLGETKPILTQLISGACFVISKQLFADIDFFDSRTFLYYEEDILWKKIQKVNKQCYVLPYISCIHLGANTTSQSSSLFIRKCHIDSMSIYLRNYSSYNILFCNFVVFAMRLILSIKKISIKYGHTIH